MRGRSGMAGETTLDEMYWPLMDADTVRLPYCAVCGRARPLEQHHIVWRSWGQLWRDGRRLEKPTVTLCGWGNNLRGPDGSMWCHGRAHHRMLHFRNDRGRLEYLMLDRPAKYQDALEMDGWEPLEVMGWEY